MRGVGIEMGEQEWGTRCAGPGVVAAAGVIAATGSAAAQLESLHAAQNARQFRAGEKARCCLPHSPTPRPHPRHATHMPWGTWLSRRSCTCDASFRILPRMAFSWGRE